jgi:hypothetical protein
MKAQYLPIVGGTAVSDAGFHTLLNARVLRYNGALQ